MNEVLRAILIRADLRDAHLFAAHEVARWPKGAVDWLMKAGILREAEPAEEVLCEECEEGCWIKPVIRKDPKTHERVGVYFCKQDKGVGRFTVNLDRKRRWEFDSAGVASALAVAIKATGPVQELHASRLYSLGTLALNDRPCEAFFVRGWAWADGQTVVDRAPAFNGAASPLVFVPARRPRRMIGGNRTALVCPLTEIASVKQGKLRLDLSAYARALASGEKRKWITVTEAAKLLMKDLLGLNLSNAKARVSMTAKRGKLTTNGKKGEDRRIEVNSFNTWRIEQRDKALDAEHDQEEDEEEEEI